MMGKENENTIPKVIHYCWFGGNPLPEEAIRCIDSWKKYCPDYEIKQWNESNFDISLCDYIQEAYAAKKWAFVSDYARFWILYNYGGLYFDTDVELINGISDIVSRGSFMGAEAYAKGTNQINAGVGLGAVAHSDFYKEVLDYYKELHFYIADGVYNDETVVTYVTNIAKKYGYKGTDEIEKVGDIYVYPPYFFCPYNYEKDLLEVVEKTRAIHWYSTSWKDEKEIEIHKKAMQIIKKNPNALGKAKGKMYEVFAKTFYFLKKEGVKGFFLRVVRKIKRKK